MVDEWLRYLGRNTPVGPEGPGDRIEPPRQLNELFQQYYNNLLGEYKESDDLKKLQLYGLKAKKNKLDLWQLYQLLQQNDRTIPTYPHPRRTRWDM